MGVAMEVMVGLVGSDLYDYVWGKRLGYEGKGEGVNEGSNVGVNRAITYIKKIKKKNSKEHTNPSSPTDSSPQSNINLPAEKWSKKPSTNSFFEEDSPANAHAALLENEEKESSIIDAKTKNAITKT